VIASIPKPARRSAKPRKRIKSRGKAGSRTSRRRKQRKAREKDCDKLFSEFIRTRDDWECRACGSPNFPQCAHILSRAYRMLRFEPDNAVCLCREHHRRWSYPNTVEWEDWVEEHFPGRLKTLKQCTRTCTWSKDYEGTMETLRNRLANLRESRMR
jgi:hypothetical protein